MENTVDADKQSKRVLHNKRAESEWARIVALISGAHEKGYGPTSSQWNQIASMATELGVGSSGAVEEGAEPELKTELEKSLYQRFRNQGETPEEARKLAKDAALKPVKRWPG